uniref:Small ribosomal subunit protein uS17c n=1 Tax=Haptophyceae sp. NIES-3900 TaxID=2748608 RepID=A0A7R6WD62_9EUKA|nr:ribosomal protein S17 [Haptophyceae sp. NIES-3900]
MPIKQRVGTVVSVKMDKTAVVAIESRIKHAKYGKVYTRTKNYKVHDPQNECLLGDVIRIQETRPLSKTKRWVSIDRVSRLSSSSL